MARRAYKVTRKGSHITRWYLCNYSCDCNRVIEIVSEENERQITDATKLYSILTHTGEDAAKLDEKLHGQSILSDGEFESVYRKAKEQLDNYIL